MRWGLLAVVVVAACRVREPDSVRSAHFFAEPGECDVVAEWDAVKPRLVARCKHVDALAPPRRTALVLAFSPAPLTTEVVVRRGTNESAIRRHFVDGTLRIDVLLDDACDVRPTIVACTLPFNLIYEVANALAVGEGLSFVEAYVGDVDKGLLRLTALRRGSPTKFDLSTLAAVRRASDGDLGKRCLGGDTDACVAHSTAAYEGPVESKSIPEPPFALPPAAPPDSKSSPPAPTPPIPTPPPVAVVKPTISCDGGSTKDCDVECAALRFASCLLASTAVRAKYSNAAATKTLPLLLDRCEHLRKALATPGTDAETRARLRLSCNSNAGLIEDAVDAIAGQDSTKLVELSITVEQRCPSCD